MPACCLCRLAGGALRCAAAHRCRYLILILRSVFLPAQAGMRPLSCRHSGSAGLSLHLSADLRAGDAIARRTAGALSHRMVGHHRTFLAPVAGCRTMAAAGCLCSLQAQAVLAPPAEPSCGVGYPRRCCGISNGAAWLSLRQAHAERPAPPYLMARVIADAPDAGISTRTAPVALGHLQPSEPAL